VIIYFSLIYKNNQENFMYTQNILSTLLLTLLRESTVVEFGEF
jgi:hypothetical protein